MKAMTKKVSRKRVDVLVAKVFDAHEGNPSGLCDELDAIHAFLETWSRDFATEGDPRMAMICHMIGALAVVIQTDLAIRFDKKVHRSLGKR